MAEKSKTKKEKDMPYDIYNTQPDMEVPRINFSQLGDVDNDQQKDKEDL